jgi:hypothetical protein
MTEYFISQEVIYGANVQKTRDNAKRNAKDTIKYPLSP